MSRRARGFATALVLLAALVPAASAEAEAEAVTRRPAEPLPLEPLFGNRTVSDDSRPAAADPDGSGASLSADDLAAAGWTPGRAPTVRGARLTWPDRRPGEPDNVRADGQSVRVRGGGDALAFLVTGTGGGEPGGPGSVSYTNGTRSSYTLTAPTSARQVMAGLRGRGPLRTPSGSRSTPSPGGRTRSTASSTSTP